MQIEFFAMSVFAGIIGTYGLLIMALWADSLGLPRLDFSRAMANVTYARTFEKEVGVGAGVDAPNTPYWPGMIVIYFNGVVFALMYSSFAASYIAAYSPIDHSAINGAIYGIILWFISGVFYVPFYLKEGFMLSHIHPLAWLTSLKVHIVYGLAVGWIAPVAS